MILFLLQGAMVPNPQQMSQREYLTNRYLENMHRGLEQILGLQDEAVNTLNERLNSSEYAVQTLSTKSMEAQVTITELTKSFKQRDSDYYKCEGELRSEKVHRQKLQDENTKLQTRLSELARSVDEFKQSLETAKENEKTTLDELTNSLNVSRDTVTELQEKLKISTAQRKDLNVQMESLRQQLEKVSAEKTKANQEKQKIMQELDALKKSSEALNASNSLSESKELERLKSSNTHLKTNSKKDKDTIKSLQDQVTQLQAEKTRLLTTQVNSRAAHQDHTHKCQSLTCLLHPHPISVQRERLEALIEGYKTLALNALRNHDFNKAQEIGQEILDNVFYRGLMEIPVARLFHMRYGTVGTSNYQEIEQLLLTNFIETKFANGIDRDICSIVIDFFIESLVVQNKREIVEKYLKIWRGDHNLCGIGESYYLEHSRIHDQSLVENDTEILRLKNELRRFQDPVIVNIYPEWSQTKLAETELKLRILRSSSEKKEATA